MHDATRALGTLSAICRTHPASAKRELHAASPWFYTRLTRQQLAAPHHPFRSAAPAAVRPPAISAARAESCSQPASAFPRSPRAA